MATNYEALATDNTRRYGEETEHLAFLGELYAERGHFILELLQNAEDARASRVEFTITDAAFEIRHNGRPFTPDDVRGICSVGRSTKKALSNRIGRFGIGFKSVYAYAALPEVHSGDEHFAIRHFVRPLAIRPSDPGAPWTTLIRLPYDDSLVPRAIARREIAAAAQNLSPQTLLFLKHISSVSFLAEGEPLADLCRFDGPPLDEPARIVRIGVLNRPPESWLVFGRSVACAMEEGSSWRGTVEVAYRLAEGATHQGLRIVDHEGATIAAYFPTDVRTGTGFVLQAPFHTTPARDNLRRDDPHNLLLVREAAELVVDTLRWLRDRRLLDVNVLAVMPLRRAEFPEGSFLAPVFDTVATALREEDLLPAHTLASDPSGYIRGKNAAAPHSQRLATLLTPDRLRELCSRADKVVWLSADLAARAQSDLGRYLQDVLGVHQIGFDECMRWLSSKNVDWWQTLDRQWLVELYEYVDAHPSRGSEFAALPCVRLANGKHVSPAENGPFFPSSDEGESAELAPFIDDLPIVDENLAAHCRPLLGKIGVAELTPENFVGRVIRRKLSEKGASVPTAECVAYLRYVKRALTQLAPGRADQVLSMVSELEIVVCNLAGNSDSLYRVKANRAYLGSKYSSSGDLEIYFKESRDTYFVFDGYLKTGENPEEWTRFLKRMGASFSPRVFISPSEYPWKAPREVSIDGLEVAVRSILHEPEFKRFHLAQAVWRVVAAVIQLAVEDRDKLNSLTRVSRSIFGPRGGYHGETSEDANWVRLLKETAWLPDTEGICRRPIELFEDSKRNRSILGDSQYFLSSEIRLDTEPSAKLADLVGVRRRPNRDAVVARLQRLASGGTSVTVEEVLPLYAFLASTTTDAFEEFKKHPLILCPHASPPWRLPRGVFWRNFSELFGSDRGYLEKLYPKLETFFKRVGVALEPTAADCIQYLQETAQGSSSTIVAPERIGAVCLRVANRLSEGGEWQGEKTWTELWTRAKLDRIWPGEVGDRTGFFAPGQLVVVDNEHRAKLFRGRLAFWLFPRSSAFALEHLHVARLSDATRSCSTEGGTVPDEGLASRLAAVWPLVLAFLESPKWQPKTRAREYAISLTPPAVARVTALTVYYEILGTEVADPDPVDAFFESAHGRIWLRHDIVDANEIAEALADELAYAFGPDALADFVQDALLKSRSDVLRRWTKKGLVVGPLSDAGEPGGEAGESTEHASGLDGMLGTPEDTRSQDANGGRSGFGGSSNPEPEIEPAAYRESDEDPDDEDADDEDADDEDADDEDADDDEEERQSGSAGVSSHDRTVHGRRDRGGVSAPSSPTRGTSRTTPFGKDRQSLEAQPAARPASRQGTVSSALVGDVPGASAAKVTPRQALCVAFNRPGQKQVRRRPFGGGPVQNAESRRQKIQDEIRLARQSEPPSHERVRQRTVDVWEPKNKEVRDFLSQEYGGDCQICGALNTFPRRSDGAPYFEAVYLIPYVTAAWSDRVGNVLCLCALCSAKWQHGSLEATDIGSQIDSLMGQSGIGVRRTVLRIHLIEKVVELRFSERHAIELQELWKAVEAEPVIRSVPSTGVTRLESTEAPTGRGTLVTCVICSASLRPDRVRSHMSRVHGNATQNQSGQQVAAPARDSANASQPRQPVSAGNRTVCSMCKKWFHGSYGQKMCPTCATGRAR